MIKGILYRKLFAYFLVVIVVSLSCLGVFSYQISSKELDVMVNHQMTQVVSNAVHHTDLYLKSYERSLISILTNEDVRRFIDLPNPSDSYDVLQFRKKISQSTIEPAFIRNPEIAAVHVISFNDNALIFFNDVEGKPYTEEEIRQHKQFFLNQTTPDGNVSILNHSIVKEKNVQLITLVRQIRGYLEHVPKGILAIEIRAEDLSALWKGIELGKNGYFFIVDDQGRYVYHPKLTNIGKEAPVELKSRLESMEPTVFEDQESGGRRMFSVQTSQYSGWKHVVSMPVDELRKPISKTRSTTITVGIFTLLFALLLAYRFGKSITGPIQVLKNGMRETEKGNWSLIPLPKRKDEIVELMTRYNLMVNRLSEMVEKVYQVELKNHEIQLERQKAEIQSLQLQINPHFMYNTLETIVCYAFIQNSQEISGIVRSLSYMLRYSVQTNLEETTVANELKHVMHYMIILRHRIRADFEIDVTIKPEFLLYQMVRLTLQPLIENVFQHAFSEGIEDFHYIRIDAGENDRLFWISVEDNGSGMTEDKLMLLRDKLNTNRLTDQLKDSKRGIGLLNVHRRIQMVFGEQYGLQVESVHERGTKITMSMPTADSYQGAASDSGDKKSL